MRIPPPISGSFCVVTPNFNMARYLPETIESVLANLGPNDRYYVVDGGSTDDSVRVLESFSDRLSGWVSEPDRGYADAVSKGFAMANTEFQCWTACGDLLLPGALTLGRTVLAQTGADMIFGDDFYIDDKSRILQITNGHASNLFAMMLYGGWTPLQDACFWRSSFYQRVGGIDTNIRYAADYDLFLRMSSNGSCIHTPHLFSAFRRHEGQTSEKHRIAYQTEKRQAALHAAKDIPAVQLPSTISAAYFWLYARLRSRIANTKALSPRIRGSEVMKQDAGLSKNFGGIE